MYKRLLLSLAIALSVAAPARAYRWKFETLEQKQACRQAVYKFQVEKEWHIDDMNERFGYHRSKEKYAYGEALRAKFKKDIRQLQKDCRGDRNMRGIASDLYHEDGLTNNPIVDHYPFN